MKIQPRKCLRGKISLPGDKSIAHRALIVSALAKGVSEVSTFPSSQDCLATLECLNALGVASEKSGDVVRINGVGQQGFKAPGVQLNCRNSGTTMRLMAGVLAGQPFTSSLIGDSSLNSRPMGRIIKPLQEMGADITSRQGKPPLRITGVAGLKAIEYDLPVASAQVKSSLMQAAQHASGLTKIREPLGQTRDHTERLLQHFGASVEMQTSNGIPSVLVEGPQKLRPQKVSIPGDVSSGAFFIAAAAMLEGSELEIEDVGLNPLRTQFLKTLIQMGMDIQIANSKGESYEPRGTIKVRGASAVGLNRAKRMVLRRAAVPALIDELPLLAVVGSQVAGIEIREAEELRHKESDRIQATAQNLREMGAEVEEHEDGLTVAGPTKLQGARIRSFGDHRIAMAFSIAALFAEGESEILDSSCVAISFPQFFAILQRLVMN